MSWFSDLFSPKQQTASVSTVADPYRQVREGVNTFLTTGLNAANESGAAVPKAYTGEKVAGMSDQEKASLGFLDQYANQGQNQTFRLSADEINKTLSGDYDPTTSPFYQAVKAESQRNLAETQKNIASNSAGAGRYWAGGRLAEQTDASTDVTNSLNTMIGEMAENERQRRLDILPTALSFAREEEESPLRKAQVLQEYGQLPRAIQQATDEADYQDWLRVNVDQPFALAQLASGVQQAPVYGQNSSSPSTFSQLVSAIPTLSSLFTKKDSTQKTP